MNRLHVGALCTEKRKGHLKNLSIYLLIPLFHQQRLNEAKTQRESVIFGNFLSVVLSYCKVGNGL